MNAEDEIWDKFWNGIECWHGVMRVTPTYKCIIKMFESIDLPKSAKILDAGCGTGKLAHFWQNRGYDTLGIDISDSALSITAKKGVKSIKADILQGLPFKDDYFDLVYSDGLLEHFVEPELVLDELFRVSGKYVLTLVPRISTLKVFIDLLVPPPKEYKRADLDWIKMHEKFLPNKIQSEKLFTALGILCEVPK